jgi:hypothetical protein
MRCYGGDAGPRSVAEQVSLIDIPFGCTSVITNSTVGASVALEAFCTSSDTPSTDSSNGCGD